MIVEYIRYHLAESAREAFEQVYGAAAPLLDESPYCLGYELTVCAEDAGQYILRITWTSAEDHLEGFRKSAGFRAFFAAIRPYVDAIQEMRHYTLTAVCSDKAGARPVKDSSLPRLAELAGSGLWEGDLSEIREDDPDSKDSRAPR